MLINRINRIVKQKCDKCGKYANHIIDSGSFISYDVFTECIYIKGKLRWAGSFIGTIQYNENVVICSECGVKYTYIGKKWFNGNMGFINHLNNENHLFLNDEDRKILEENGIECSSYTLKIVKIKEGVNII